MANGGDQSHTTHSHGPGVVWKMECKRWNMESGKASNSNNILIVFVEVQKGWKPELADTSD